ncbi:MAG: TolC family protein [Sphingomonadales bacterium]|nr:TolC family protein [Sphingomonadales bacterium]
MVSQVSQVPSRNTRIAIPILSLAALAGCAPTIKLAEADRSLPPTYEASAHSSETTLQLDHWWQGFNDPQLTGLIEQALEHSTTARMAYARIAEARALRNQARAGTLPSGSISGSASERGSEGLWGAGSDQSGNQAYQAGFNASWELDIFGRLGAIRDRADADAAVATYDFYGTRMALVADVANALFLSRYLAVQRVEAEDGLRIARELARTAAIGQQKGLISGQDRARLDADVEANAAEVTRIGAELQNSVRALLILTGQATAPTSSLGIEPRLSTPPALPDNTPGSLLTRRPDVLSAEAALRSATAGVEVSRLALFPQFTIQPGIGLSAIGTPAAGTGLWSLAGGLALPVLDRPRLMAALRVSEARGNQAAIGYERAVQTAYGDAEKALVTLSATRQRLGQLERAEADSRRAFDAARRGYQAGLTDLTTLLQVERTWRQNRAALHAVRAGMLTGTVNAIRALGGGWNPVAISAGPPNFPSQPGLP